MDTKSSWLSKINWTQAVTVGLNIITLFGIDVPPETKAQIMAAITALGGVATWVMRTWFTTKLTNASVGQ